MLLKQIKNKLYDLWSVKTGSYIFVALLFLAVFVLPPLINGEFISSALAEVLFITILITGAYAIDCGYTIRLMILIFAFSALALRAFHQIYLANPMLAILNNILAICTLALFAFLLIRRFLEEHSEIKFRIAGAVAIYLLLGILWARLYEIAFLLDPNAFSMQSHVTPFTFVYFSIVTLVTLGYGDIVPVGDFARSLAMLEGVVGQLYMVILISSLVSRFTATTLEE